MSRIHMPPDTSHRTYFPATATPPPRASIIARKTPIARHPSTAVHITVVLEAAHQVWLDMPSPAPVVVHHGYVSPHICVAPIGPSIFVNPAREVEICPQLLPRVYLSVTLRLLDFVRSEFDLLASRVMGAEPAPDPRWAGADRLALRIRIKLTPSAPPLRRLCSAQCANRVYHGTSPCCLIVVYCRDVGSSPRNKFCPYFSRSSILPSRPTETQGRGPGRLRPAASQAAVSQKSGASASPGRSVRTTTLQLTASKLSKCTHKSRATVGLLVDLPVLLQRPVHA